MVDKQLLYRIEQYLDDNKPKVANVELLASHLQTTYRDYGRKKKIPFKHAVEQAHAIVHQRRKKLDNLTAKDSLLDKLEAKHLMKKRRQDDDRKMSDSYSSESSNSEDYVEYKDSNMMNSLVTSLYSANKSPSVKAQDGGEISADTNVSFTIDRVGDVHTILSQSNTVTSPTEQVLSICNKIGHPSNSFPPSNVIIIDEDNTECKSCLGTPGKGTSDASLQSASALKDGVQRKSNKRKRPVLYQDFSETDKTSKKTKFEAIQSTTTIADVGGNTEAIIKALELFLHLDNNDKAEMAIPSQKILLYGPSGCGKTLLACAIAGEVGCPLIKISSTSLVSGVSGESEDQIRTLFDDARENAPCIVFLDDIDSITQKRETASKNMEYRIVLQLCSCLDELSKSEKPVFIIGATNRIDSLDQALRSRFDSEISVGIPDEAARLKILQVLCLNTRLSPGVDLRKLAKRTPGYVGTDIRSLLNKAQIARNRRIKEESDVYPNDSTTVTCSTVSDSSNAIHTLSEILDPKIVKLQRLLKVTVADEVSWELTMKDFEEALKQVLPAAKREGFPTIPDVSWADVGGLHEIRNQLVESIIWPAKYPKRCREVDVVRSGILLSGPPGNGKTLLAKAVSNESGLNFMCVNGPELLNMYVGESERLVRQVFARAASNLPCVIFFDELDALGHRRQNSDVSGNKANVLDQLLTMLDGFEGRKQVFVMGATNRPDMIDKALLRPGRFDKILYVGLPDEASRTEILKAHSNKFSLGSDVCLSEIASRCEGMSGADLAQVFREAGKIAMREIMNDLEKSNPSALEDEDQIPHIVIQQGHLLAGCIRVTPSVSPEDIRMYERLKAANQLSSCVT